MEGINKLRAMTLWFNDQEEYITDGLSFKSLEKLFDYSVENELPYMDDDYLYSNSVTVEQRDKALKFIKKLRERQGV